MARQRYLSAMICGPCRSAGYECRLGEFPQYLPGTRQFARELAARTHTPLIVVKNGKLVEETVPPPTAAGKK